jgi:transposase
MRKLYRVTLTQEEVLHLTDVLRKGKRSAQIRNRAQALLHAHNGMTDASIAQATGMTSRALELLRQRFVEEGFESTLNGKPRGHRDAVLDGRAEAQLVALVCSPKPEGRRRWTIRLLRDRLVAMLELDSLSHETVRQTLKKMNLNLGSE